MKVRLLLLLLGILILCSQVSAEGGPKLIVGEDMKTSPTTLTINEPFTLSFTVNNFGDNFNGNFTVKIKLDGKEAINEIFTKEIPPGDSLVISTGEELFFDKGGSHLIEWGVYYGSNAYSTKWKEVSVDAPITTVYNPPGGNSSDLPGTGFGPGIDTKKAQENPLPFSVETILMIAAGTIIAIILLIILRGRGQKKKEEEEVLVGKLEERENEMQELVDERKALKDSMDMAKIGYFKRQIDEESYKKMVMETQQKLFLVESKIKKLKGE
jgi:hypothetical protein